MPRIEPEDLSDPERVFVGSSLKRAQEAEQVLAGHGIDYAVQVEQIGRSFLFGSPIHAAVFYVASAQASYCRSELTLVGLGTGVIEDASG
jgi:hypothetical protein